MSFFEYRQNNSGGHWVFDDKRGISCLVVVEAASAEEADSKAGRIGLYFDGVGDCDCCGRRWHTAYSESEDALSGLSFDLGNKKPTAYVHYADGRVVGGLRPGGYDWRNE